MDGCTSELWKLVCMLTEIQIDILEAEEEMMY